MSENVMLWLGTLGLSGLVAYFTASATLSIRMATLEERESNHYDEIIRRLDSIDKKLD